MKKILGLDIGVSSVGLSVVYEENKQKKIADMAVRIIPEDPNFHGKFYSGNTASKNLERTTNRGIRRGYQRFQQRRDNLYKLLKENNMFPNESLFKLNSTELYKLRAIAVTQKINLEELGRVLILLNQRRGFLSNRKSNSEEENSTDYKKRISELENELNGKTIGQQLFSELESAKNIFEILLRERTYLRKSYIEEFDRIWECQKQFYQNLTGGINEDENKGTLYHTIRNKIIYYQRPLKSQKGLVSECSFEKHHKAVAKSSPYFEIFKIWQRINDLEVSFQDGSKMKPSFEQKQLLFNALFYGEKLNNKFKITVTEIKKILALKRNEGYLNFTELDGSRTYSILKNALIKAEIKSPESILFFNLDKNDEKGGLLELWHITYSIPNESEVLNALVKRFQFTNEQAKVIAKEVAYNSEFGNLSTRAIRKLLTHLQKGLNYSEACDAVNYDHSGYKTKIQLQDKLKPIKQNSLRNPVVEQVLNQVVNVVNLAITKHGKFDEIRVELARELRNSAKTRKNITKLNGRNKKENDKVREILSKEYSYKIVNGRDTQRYKLWNETDKHCLYCSNPISKTDFITGNGEIEHILPKSRSFSNNSNNFILAHRKCNSGNEGKNQMTAYDFMASKGAEVLEQYIKKVNSFYKDGEGSLSKAKFENLLCKGEDIPSDFVERMKKDTQYISKEAVRLLKSVCENTYTTTGQITDFLREKWELKNVLQEINMGKYKAIGHVEIKEYKDRIGNIRSYETIKDWSKRDDHRHHAVDALICALTDQKIIFKLNNLNKIYQYQKEALSEKELEEIKKTYEFQKLDIKSFADLIDDYYNAPIPNFKEEVRRHLDNIFVSIKKSSKVLSKNINHPKKSEPQITWTPRGRIHEDTVMGLVKRVSGNKVKLNEKFNNIQNIVNPKIRVLVENHLAQFNGNIAIAFNSKTLKAQPVLYKDSELKEIQVYEEAFTKRVPISENFTSAQVEKIADDAIKQIIQERIKEKNGKIKEAFTNLKENPIWLNKEKGIQIKAVTVFDESKVEKVRSGYVKTGGNHHTLIYKNKDGKYVDKVISFWEAVTIGNLNIQQTGKPYPIINKKDSPEYGAFQFSMQINDLFVFDLKHSENPTEEEINFIDTKNRNIISEKLFRLQKMSKKSNGQFDIHFRHHLETSVERNIPNLTWINITSNTQLSRLCKLRINHLGDIIKVGE
ncbi:MAG: cas9 [Bacteroidetes bacterium]|nr:cas9 [Bacteroidota bacterium]